MLPNPLFLNVRMYGIMVALGILAAFAVLFFYTKKMKLATKFVDFIFYNAIASIVVGIFFATLFQSFYNYLDNPEAGFRLGGMTFIGGLIGGAATFLIIYFSLRKRLAGRLIDAISMVPCAILVAHGFGRIGCFFAGCCYGKVTDSFLGIKFPGMTEAVHPTQLYEAVFLFVMFGVCSYLLLKWNYQYNMSIYLVTYGIFRFLIEFLRGDERGTFVAGISPSQFWSILMVALGVGSYFFHRYLLQKRSGESAEDGKAE